MIASLDSLHCFSREDLRLSAVGKARVQVLTYAKKNDVLDCAGVDVKDAVFSTDTSTHKTAKAMCILAAGPPSAQALSMVRGALS